MIKRKITSYDLFLVFSYPPLHMVCAEVKDVEVKCGYVRDVRGSEDCQLSIVLLMAEISSDGILPPRSVCRVLADVHYISFHRISC